MVFAFAGQMPPRDLIELAADERQHLIERSPIAILPSNQKLRDVVPVDRHLRPIIAPRGAQARQRAASSRGAQARQRAASKAGRTRIAIVPGNRKSSRLYVRITNGTMPPTGRLTDSEIAVFKNWIDQGPDWPDDVSGESEPPPVDPTAVRLMNALRQG